MARRHPLTIPLAVLTAALGVCMVVMVAAWATDALSVYDIAVRVARWAGITLALLAGVALLLRRR